MNQAPLVSIAMAAYNADRWLPAALGSALAQTYAHIEIVVVNDGSTDSTAAILSDYARAHPDRLRVFSQPNRGQSAALNRAFAETRGEYVKFFDADDILAPETISIQLAALQSAPAGHLAYGEWARFRTDLSEADFRPRPGWHNSDRPLDWICETWSDSEPMYQCALWLIPRALLDRAGGWREELNLINDFEFFTRLILCSSGIVHTPRARLYYRSGLAGSLSARKSRLAWESACFSTHLACEHLLLREDSPRTRRVAADACQNLVLSIYPDHPDLVADLLSEVRRLGGSRCLPDGGRIFRLLARTLGWHTALRLRAILSRVQGKHHP